MGGFGSGRHGGKRCTDDMHRLDVRKLQRQGLLTEGRSLSWTWTVNDEKVAFINIRVNDGSLTLSYRQRDRGAEWQDMNYPVRLTWTACRYGGRRVWLLCPAVGCGRRVAVLYGGRVFACRHCHRLAYRSQREAPDDRATRRADKLRVRLKWEPGILNGDGWKPKGMHWKTFQRLQSHLVAQTNTALARMARLMGLRMGSAEEINRAIVDF